MKKNLLFISILSLGLVCCQIEALEPMQADTYSPAEFQAETENFEEMTKTALNSNRAVVWSAGDQLAIFQGCSIADKYQVNDINIGSTNGSFSIVENYESTEDSDFVGGTEVTYDVNVAVYPYGSDLVCNPAYENDDILSYSISKVTIPSVQHYVPNSFPDETFIMTAVTRRKADHTLKFRNVCGILKLQLKGAATIKSIELTGNNNEPLSGKAIVTAFPDNAAPEIELSADASRSITLDCADGVQLNEDNSTSFLITVPPTTFDNGFTVTITDINGNTDKLSTSKLNTIQRSGILKMPEASVKTRKDLSENGTSNCYIASKGGSYSFNCTVEGNSDNVIADIAYASVIWETFNSQETPEIGDIVQNVKCDNGVITFDTTDNNGNALIAVTDNDGNILWSWHIWVTDYRPYESYDIYKGWEDLKVMDRNLGAMDNAPGDNSVGLVYQWGRKEPFMGCNSTGTFLSTSEAYIVNSSPSVGTDEYAIQNPTAYIIANNQGDDWRYVSDNSAWSSEKTKYDPCPIGWKLPEGGIKGLWKNFDISDSQDWNFSYTLGGMQFGKEFASSEVWMPAQGYMADSDSYHTGWWRVGSEGRYWTTTTLGSAHSDYFSFQNNETSIEHSNVDWDTHCSRATGMAVRCIEDTLDFRKDRE